MVGFGPSADGKLGEVASVVCDLLPAADPLLCAFPVEVVGCCPWGGSVA